MIAASMDQYNFTAIWVNLAGRLPPFHAANPGTFHQVSPNSSTESSLRSTKLPIDSTLRGQLSTDSSLRAQLSTEPAASVTFPSMRNNGANADSRSRYSSQPQHLSSRNGLERRNRRHIVQCIPQPGKFAFLLFYRKLFCFNYVLSAFFDKSEMIKALIEQNKAMMEMMKDQSEKKK